MIQSYYTLKVFRLGHIEFTQAQNKILLVSLSFHICMEDCFLLCEVSNFPTDVCDEMDLQLET